MLPCIINQSHYRREMPRGFQEVKVPRLGDNDPEGCAKVVSLTHRPFLPPGNTPGTHFCYRLSRGQGHSAIGRIMSMQNSNDTIWNRTSDLPICSAAPPLCYLGPLPCIIQGNFQRRGRDFSRPSRLALKPTQPSLQLVLVLSRG